MTLRPPKKRKKINVLHRDSGLIFENVTILTSYSNKNNNTDKFKSVVVEACLRTDHASAQALIENIGISLEEGCSFHEVILAHEDLQPTGKWRCIIRERINNPSESVFIFKKSGPEIRDIVWQKKALKRMSL